MISSMISKSFFVSLVDEAWISGRASLHWTDVLIRLMMTLAFFACSEISTPSPGVVDELAVTTAFSLGLSTLRASLAGADLVGTKTTGLGVDVLAFSCKIESCRKSLIGVSMVNSSPELLKTEKLAAFAMLAAVRLEKDVITSVHRTRQGVDMKGVV